MSSEDYEFSENASSKCYFIRVLLIDLLATWGAVRQTFNNNTDILSPDKVKYWMCEQTHQADLKT